MSTKCLCRTLLDFFTLGVVSNLPLTGDESTAYIAEMKKVGDAEHRKFIFEHFYRNLDVLDRKTNAMFQFTAIMVFIYAALIEHQYPKVGHGLIFGAFPAFFAALMFLFVETVHWSSPADILDTDGHARYLLKIRDRRTIFYRLGWILSLLSLVILAISLSRLAGN